MLDGNAVSRWRKNVNDFYSIIDCEEYKSKFLFEAINKFTSKSRVNVYENKYKQIIKLTQQSS